MNLGTGVAGQTNEASKMSECRAQLTPHPARDGW